MNSFLVDFDECCRNRYKCSLLNVIRKNCDGSGLDGCYILCLGRQAIDTKENIEHLF